MIVKVTAEKKQTTKESKTATYYIVQFSYAAADPAEVAARRDFARNFPIWRAETYTGAADMRILHAYIVPTENGPEPAGEAAALPMAA